MNWLKGDLAFTSSFDQQFPRVSRGGVQRENWILAASRNWPRCPSERIVPVTCRRPFRAPQTTDSATSRGLLLFGERSQHSSRSARAPIPQVCRWLDSSANSVKPRWVSPSSSRRRQMRRPSFWRKPRLNARRFIWRLMLMEQTRLIQVLNHLWALLSLDRVWLTTKEAKELNPPPPQQQNLPQLLGAQNCVFGGLGDAELDHPFCSNLDGLAGCWISTHASFAIHQNNLAQSRNREGVLGVLVSQCHQSFQGLHGLFLG